MELPPITEIKRRLDGSETRFACRLALLEPGRRAVLVYVIDRVWAVDGIALAPGMLTYAHYWLERPYNVYHWLDGARTVGHYANVGACERIERDGIRWTDHAVDVLITPDGKVRVLDEEELAGVDAVTRERVERVRDAIVADARSIAREVEGETRRLLK